MNSRRLTTKTGAGELKKGSQQADTRLDRAWIAGAKFGWNCGDAGNSKKFNDAIRARFEDIAAATPPANVAPRCPRCGRRLRSEFDEDVGFWREGDTCDYREQVPPAPTAAPPTSIETLAPDNHPLA